MYKLCESAFKQTILILALNTNICIYIIYYNINVKQNDTLEIGKLRKGYISHCVIHRLRLSHAVLIVTFTHEYQAW